MTDNVELAESVPLTTISNALVTAELDAEENRRPPCRHAAELHGDAVVQVVGINRPCWLLLKAIVVVDRSVIVPVAEAVVRLGPPVTSDRVKPSVLVCADPEQWRHQ